MLRWWRGSGANLAVTMRVYLIHHAHAVDAPPGASFLDDLRALTPAGRRRFARTARRSRSGEKESESGRSPG